MVGPLVSENRISDMSDAVKDYSQKSSGHRAWTRVEEQRAVALARSGLKAAAVARRLGRSRSAVGLRLWKLGERSQPGKGVHDATVRRLVRKGWYDWEVALELGVCPSRAAKIRRRLGLPPNSPAQAARARAKWARKGVSRVG
jgi:hypothetical protein